ncbi:hypothetical protein D1164_02105 [Mariniphaga sediminis]|uniref:SGNH hydrolase-type esterase domain-containing protein n=1 Tax=Mariniphaga sediminis TaxID=1628158 RepID=A0A399D875_9BACT|nr:hypothetical protein D1164_02105 [Mariniphaga sediminis]
MLNYSYRIFWPLLIILWLSNIFAFGNESVIVLNKGIGGNSSTDLLNRIERDLIAHQPDIAIIMIGTNDLLNSRKKVSEHLFLSNIKKLTDTLALHGIEATWVSPPPVDTSYLFQRHDPSHYLTPPNEALKRASDSLQVLCEKEGLLFVDVFSHFKNKGLPNHEKDEIVRNITNSGEKDGVHLTAKGNRLLAQIIYGALSERYGTMRHLKIVCFGDSLTFGVYMKGEGTAEGDTYPAILKQLITRS